MKINNTFIISVFLLFQTGQLCGQVYEEMVRISTDSIHQAHSYLDGTNEIDAFNKLALAYCRDFSDSCIDYATRAKTLAEQLDYNKGVADAHLYLGYSFLYQDSLKHAVINFLDALRIYEELEPSMELGFNLRMLQAVNMFTGRYSESKQYGRRAEIVLGALSENEYRIRSVVTMGLSDTESQEYDSATFHFDRALALLDQYPNPKLRASALFDKGYNYRIQYDATGDEKYIHYAIEWFLKTLEMKGGNLKPYLESLIMIHLGDLYLKLDKAKNLEKAISYYQSAAAIADTLQVRAQVAIMAVYSNMATVEYERANYDEAIRLLVKALEDGEAKMKGYTSRDYSDPIHMIIDKVYYRIAQEDAYELLFEIYMAKEDFGNAIHYYTLMQKKEQEINLQSKRNLIAVLEAKSENEKHKSNILALQNRNLRLKNQNINYLSAGSGVVLILFFMIALNRQRSRKNKIIADQRILQLEEEKKLLGARSVVEGQEEERKRVARELHDGLGVLLSSAKMHFSAFKDQISGENQVVDQVSKLLEQAATDVRRISHNMMPGLLTKYGLVEALEDLFDQLNEIQGINGIIKVSGEQSRLDEKVEIMIYRVIQEMVNNTLKHAEASNILLHFRFQHDKLVVHFSDDGKGFDFKEKIDSKSLGLTGLQSRVSFLGSELRWESSPGNGTTYNFEILQ